MDSDDSLIAALAELLCRRCLGHKRSGDVETLLQMRAELNGAALDPDLHEIATASVSASLDPGDVTCYRSAASARRLLITELGDAQRLLASVALALLAERGPLDRAARDFVIVAISAQRIEQDDLAQWAAERALALRRHLSDSLETAARLALSVVTQDPAEIRKAYALASSLPEDDPWARHAENLRPTLHPDEISTMSAVGESVRAGDRQAAARSLAEDFRKVWDETGNPVVAGLYTTMQALSAPEVDVRNARDGLTQVVSRLRTRQRYGQIPPVAKAGIDLAADLLKLDATPASADLLVELLEALADAGLSEVVLEADLDDIPQLIQARLAKAALGETIWPDLRACVDGLRGRPALILRRQRMFAARNGAVMSVFIQPPDSVAIKSTLLNDCDMHLLRSFGSGDPTRIMRTTVGQVDDLVRSLMPSTLIEGLRPGGIETLLIVPDGPLWSVPWQAANVLRCATVCLAPSLSVYARLSPYDGVVRSVTAFVDANLPDAARVLAALDAAASSRRLRISNGFNEDGPSDLTLVFAHGRGSGLEFRTGSGTASLSALALAASTKSRAAMVASCWALTEPPVSFPVTLPAALMLSGVSVVAGGLWPLPAEPTARTVAGVIDRLAAGERFVRALSGAAADRPDRLLERWGFAVHGFAREAARHG